MALKKSSVILLAVGASLSALTLVATVPLAVLGVRTLALKSDYAYLKNDTRYSTNVKIDGIANVEQHFSCGYATIEMLSSYYQEPISEQALSDRHNGAIVTSSTNGFLFEVNDVIKSKKFEVKSYLRNDDLLKEIHDSLEASNPVALEWAALYENEWTLHFSLITALDIAGDSIRINNPYGYVETLTIGDFLDRSSFESFKGMPFFYTFGFAFNAFHKNTIFMAKR